MGQVKIRMFLAAAVVFVLGFSLAANAQGAESVYKAKCAGCHGVDGTGSSIGKKLGAHDFHSADVQGQSDEQLAEAIAKGTNKMPGYEKSLKPDDIKALVAYVRSLGKK
jgi:mono/diheme cytochrome c family protein